MPNLVLSPIDPSLLISSIAKETASEVIRKLSEKESLSNQDEWLNLNELCAYHPDKPSKQTVYEWVSKRKIPFYKDGRKLRFLKSEIDADLKEGKRRTQKEVALDVESYYSQKNKKG
jgi:excisionase family DNA binding protein